MVKMSEMTDKDFEARKPYFDVGPHEVYINDFSTGKTPNTGSEYIEFDLVGENDEEGNVRLWLTEKTVDRTRSILAAIAVHNKKTDAEKDKVREAFKKITDSEEMLTPDFLEKFKDMQAWILTEEDKNAPKPNGGFYLRNNLYSYQPTPRKQTAEDIMNASTPSDLDEVPFN